MKNVIFTVRCNREIAVNTYETVLTGDTEAITAPGQFVNLKLEGRFLRRPISVCNLDGNTLTLVYKTVGGGTTQMSHFAPGTSVDVLTGLGNGYNAAISGDCPVLIGGGAGVPPLYYLARCLIAQGKTVTVIAGFGCAREVFYTDAFAALGARVFITTVDGSVGIRGFVTDALTDSYSSLYACGPEPMLKAVYNKTAIPGQFSFEERMGCGFGACMGCSCRTKYGNKRICRDGPVLTREEIIW